MEKDHLRRYYSNVEKKVSHPLTKANQNLRVNQRLSDRTSKVEHLTLLQSELKNYFPLATNSPQILSIHFCFFTKKNPTHLILKLQIYSVNSIRYLYIFICKSTVKKANSAIFTVNASSSKGIIF